MAKLKFPPGTIGYYDPADHRLIKPISINQALIMERGSIAHVVRSRKGEVVLAYRLTRTTTYGNGAVAVRSMLTAASVNVRRIPRIRDARNQIISPPLSWEPKNRGGLSRPAVAGTIVESEQRIPPSNRSAKDEARAGGPEALPLGELQRRVEEAIKCLNEWSTRPGYKKQSYDLAEFTDRMKNLPQLGVQ
jgi:hypothetical protein